MSRRRYFDKVNHNALLRTNSRHFSEDGWVNVHVQYLRLNGHKSTTMTHFPE